MTAISWAIYVPSWALHELPRLRGNGRGKTLMRVFFSLPRSGRVCNRRA